MRPTAILDIDTTLANNDHRAELLLRVCASCAKPMQGQRGQEKWPVCECGGIKYVAPQSAWDAFLAPELMIKDIPQPHAVDVLDQMRSNNWNLVFLTGRNEKHRPVTEEWLNRHMSRSPSELVLMRYADDPGTPASQMKERLFLNYRKDHGLENSYFMFFEDDRFVIPMWQKYGMVWLCPEAWEHMNPVGHERHIEPGWNR